MKKAFYVFLPILLIGGAVYLVWRKMTAAKTPTQTSANTANANASLNQYPGWLSFTGSALNNAQGYVNGLLKQFGQVSNIFGSNDGGANPGVAISGSNNGGTASSGGGVGLVTSLSNTISNIWDRAFTQNNYASAPLNNYDAQTAANQGASAASSNAVDTGVDGGDFSDLD